MSVIPMQKIKEIQDLIEPFDENLIEPASADLRVGRRALKSPVGSKRGEVVDLDREEKSIQLLSGQFISILSLEKLNLPLDICGRVGLRSSYARRGLIAFHGAQIDPGFKGHLVVPLINVGPETIVLEYGEPFCTLEFSRLEAPSEKGYSGEYQDLPDFPGDDINFMLRAKTVSLAEIPELRLNVNELKKMLLQTQPRFATLLCFILSGFFIIVSIISWRFFEPWVAIASFGVALTALLGGISSYVKNPKEG